MVDGMSRSTMSASDTDTRSTHFGHVHPMSCDDATSVSSMTSDCIDVSAAWIASIESIGTATIAVRSAVICECLSFSSLSTTGVGGVPRRSIAIASRSTTCGSAYQSADTRTSSESTMELITGMRSLSADSTAGNRLRFDGQFSMTVFIV